MICAVREDGGEIFEVPFVNETSTWSTYLLISYPRSNQLEIILLKLFQSHFSNARKKTNRITIQRSISFWRLLLYQCISLYTVKLFSFRLPFNIHFLLKSHCHFKIQILLLCFLSIILSVAAERNYSVFDYSRREH